MVKRLVGLSVHQTSKVFAICAATMMLVFMLVLLPVYVWVGELSGPEAMFVFFLLPPLYLVFVYVAVSIWVWVFNRIAPWAGGVPLKFAETGGAAMGAEGS